MDRDPVAQRQVARINKYRGEYDRWGNRLTRTMLNTKHLLETGSSEDIFKTIQDELECAEPERPVTVDEDHEEEPRQHRPRRRQLENPETLNVRNYNFGRRKHFLLFPSIMR